MNDTFDLMNLCKLAEAIFNDTVQWERRKKPLEQLLVILNNTEKMYNKMEAERKAREKEEKRLIREMERAEKIKKEERLRNASKRRKTVENADEDDFDEDFEEDSDAEDDLFKDAEEEKKRKEEEKKETNKGKKEGKKRKKKELNMFASKTTIEGWRLTVTTLLDSIPELFDNIVSNGVHQKTQSRPYRSE